MTSPQASAIIPTHRRSREAVRSITSLLDQRVRDFEIIVVENEQTPTDLTKLVGQIKAGTEIPIRYVHEPNLGLHNARHAGALAASSDLLLFSDDDVTFSEDWIGCHTEAFDSHPEMAAAGGPIRPIFDAHPPNWLIGLLRREPQVGLLGLMEPHSQFMLGREGFFYGGNLAIRRDLMFESGGFNPDCVGTIRMGDGENGLLNKLRQRGALIGYVPGAVVYHHIPAARMTVDFLLQRSRYQGAADAFTRYHMRSVTPRRALVDLITHSLSSLKYWIGVPLMHQRRLDPLSLGRRFKRVQTLEEARYLARAIIDPHWRQLLDKDWLGSSTPSVDPS